MDGLPEVSCWEVMSGERLEAVGDHRRGLCAHVLMQLAKIASYCQSFFRVVNLAKTVSGSVPSFTCRNAFTGFCCSTIEWHAAGLLKQSAESSVEVGTGCHEQRSQRERGLSTLLGQTAVLLRADPLHSSSAAYWMDISLPQLPCTCTTHLSALASC